MQEHATPAKQPYALKAALIRQGGFLIPKINHEYQHPEKSRKNHGRGKEEKARR
jgi:hypothetical protein